LGCGVVKNVDDGVKELLSVSPLVTALVLGIICLMWFIKTLLKEAKEERTLNREALINNTAVISEFKELIRNALNK
jgi:hypothetical protein